MTIKGYLQWTNCILMTLNNLLYSIFSYVVALYIIVNSSKINLIPCIAKTNTCYRVLSLQNSKLLFGSLFPNSKWSVITYTSNEISNFFRTWNSLNNAVMSFVFTKYFCCLYIPVAHTSISRTRDQVISMRPN